MLIKGDALVGAVTVAFTISGQKNEWTVTTVAPGGIVVTTETVEAQPYVLLTEMLRTAVENTNRRRFPERQKVAIR